MKYLALLSAGALSIGLAGCSSADNEEPAATQAPTTVQSLEDQDDDATEATTEADDAQAAGAFADTQAGIEAVKAAEAKAGGVAVSLDRDDDKSAWEVTVIEDNTEVEYEISRDGSVTEVERDDDDDNDEARYIADAIPMIDAIEIAAADIPDGYLDEVELDEDDGAVTWKIDFDDASGNDLQDVVLDYKSGEILKMGTDD